MDVILVRGVSRRDFKMIAKNIVFVLLLASYSYGANILAIIPTPSYSHQIAYTHVWKELSLRGHKVTLITTDPFKDPKLINLTEIDMHNSYKLAANFLKKLQNSMTMWNTHDAVGNIGLQVAEEQLSHPEVQNLIHNKGHFDVVLVEFLYPEYLAFAEIYDCPKIVICTLDASAVFHYYFGNPITPALYPEIGATFYGSLNFKERIVSALYTWHTMYLYLYRIFNNRNDIVRKYFNISKTVHEMINDVDLMFLSVNPILQSIRALGPSTITIAGSREVVNLTFLPQDLAEFLDSAVDGFIYFSLGSNVKSNDLNKETKEAIIETLRELPYKVLWKFEADELPNKPENVKLIKWAPQQTVLSHPNIKLFVTQGGLQSMEEGLNSEVPFVVIPFIGDQYQNAKLMESKGIAVRVNKEPFINKLELKNSILEVINNPKYRETVKKMNHLISDSPMTGLEKAIWWTEYVIRNKGAKYLRNPAADIPFYQYYLLDVISFLILSIVSVLTLLYIVLKKIYRYTQLMFNDKQNLNKKKVKSN